jgi:hypothetical protein
MGRNSTSERKVHGKFAPGALVLHPGMRDAGHMPRAGHGRSTVALSPSRLEPNGSHASPSCVFARPAPDAFPIGSLSGGITAGRLVVRLGSQPTRPSLR